MVQPKLDYASTSWDPFTKGDINTLEKVQRRGARYVSNNYADRSPRCVTTMLESLNWIPLITRRYNLHIIMLYKLQYCLVGIGDCNILRPGDQRTRGAYRLYRPPVTLCIYKYYFFPRMVNYWNRLPTRVKDCHTLEEFKAALIPAAFSPTLVY